MQNTISCTHPVQNAAYCTGLAANAGSSKMGKDSEAGGSTRVSAIVDGSECRFKACQAGSIRAITASPELFSACPASEERIVPAWH